MTRVVQMRYARALLFFGLGSLVACTGLKDDDNSSSEKDASLPISAGGSGGSSGLDPIVMLPKGMGGSGASGTGGGDASTGAGGSTEPALDAGQSDAGEVLPDSGPPPACEAMSTFYADADGDSYGDPDATMEGCEPPEHYVANKDDCDDDCNECYPGNLERCDNHD